MDQIKQESDEYAIQEKLTEWLESNGAEVYWGESPEPYDHKTFQVKSKAVDSWDKSSHQPDLLVSFDEYTTITEIKSGEEYGDIADGVFQTFDYWKSIKMVD